MIDVLLLRDVPEERRLSMERFADELERGFADSSPIRIRSMAVHESPLARRLGLARVGNYATRFVHYPVVAGRAHADIYHIADHGYGDLAWRLPKERTIVTCHDLMLLKGEQGLAGFRGSRTSVIRFRWSTSFLRKVAHVVCNTETTKRDVVELLGLGESRISVVPYGVNPYFRPLDAATVASVRAPIVRAGERAILHVSTGHPYKNVPATLRVTASLRASGVDAVLVRAGNPLNPEQRSLASELGLEGSVRELGFVFGERLVALYNACDLLLFPSWYEGFGWPPLEAMACGLPIVSSDCAALREVVGDAGLTAAPNDIEGLTAAVGSLLESAVLAARFRALGLARASAYTWERTCEGYRRIYEQVAEESQEGV